MDSYIPLPLLLSLKQFQKHMHYDTYCSIHVTNLSNHSLHTNQEYIKRNSHHLLLSPIHRRKIATTILEYFSFLLLSLLYHQQLNIFTIIYLCSCTIFHHVPKSKIQLLLWWIIFEVLSLLGSSQLLSCCISKLQQYYIFCMCLWWILY